VQVVCRWVGPTDGCTERLSAIGFDIQSVRCSICQRELFDLRSGGVAEQSGGLGSI